jgi:hypothetical protein
MGKFEEYLEALIADLNDRLTLQHYDVQKVSTKELTHLLNKILDGISIKYEAYKKFIPSVLALLEKNRTTSMEILIDVFFGYYYELIKIGELRELDKSLLNAEFEDSIVDKFYKAVGPSFKENPLIRISGFKLDKSSIPKEDRVKYISLITSFLQESAKSMNWDKDRIELAFIQLAVLRNLLNDVGDFQSFYILSAITIDRLSTSEFHQHSRDLAEELIVSSYSDENEHLGYFNAFRCYSNNSSAIPGLLYANLALCSALKAKEKVSTWFVKEIIWQGIKYFRNISLHGFVQEIYESIPNKLHFEPYEKRAIAHSYFLSLLMMNDKKLPDLILDFLNENREAIYKTGVHDALPWLLTLYNIKRIYQGADFSNVGLGYYLTTFEMIVPTDVLIDQKAIIEGDLKRLKEMLRESLVKLNETRNSLDIVNDNATAIKIASRLVDQAVLMEDHEALLLAMTVKSDFSFIFSRKQRDEVAEVKIPDTSIESFEKIYGSEANAIDILDAYGNGVFIWIILTETRCYQLSYKKAEFQYHNLLDWNLGTFTELIKSGFFSLFVFDDTIKTKYEVRSLLPEEYIVESDILKKQFAFFSLIPPDEESDLLIVMDMGLAGFPHNLLLGDNGAPLHLQHPICNILSTEWFLKYSNLTKINKAFPKAIWIPTEGEDFTLLHLFGKLEETLNANRFSVLQSIEPERPIKSDLNIICAHGAQDIALRQVIFPDDSPRLNLDKYLGGGKVLIFFVCHSGSVSATPFENSISSIVKKYIEKGYSSVIAPFWALHINIPPIWLPVFIKSLDEGGKVIKAVHEANLAVSRVYPTMSAWACLHLYGDPNLTLES